MNRAEKEMLKKRTAEREGLSEEECRKLDELNKLVHDVHYIVDQLVELIQLSALFLG